MAQLDAHLRVKQQQQNWGRVKSVLRYRWIKLIKFIMLEFDLNFDQICHKTEERSNLIDTIPERTVLQSSRCIFFLKNNSHFQCTFRSSWNGGQNLVVKFCEIVQTVKSFFHSNPINWLKGQFYVNIHPAFTDILETAWKVTCKYVNKPYPQKS